MKQKFNVIYLEGHQIDLVLCIILLTIRNSTQNGSDRNIISPYDADTYSARQEMRSERHQKSTIFSLDMRPNYQN